jgi:diadenosine tetraphosphatase ApaH/serine/threonine PP2A family protein phosphatase
MKGLGYQFNMRILVISDIHANLTALEAVLADAGEINTAWCLGDLVGYGPDPNECIARVRSLPNLVCLIGNHDAAALHQIDTDNFNPDARTAIEWTRQTLTPDAYAFLQSLPEKVVVDLVTLAHGSPRQPVWEYLLDTRTASLNFNFFVTPYCLVGHTHLPVVYYMPDDSRTARLVVPEAFMQMTLAPRDILNPGSVGQPRDRDPRAAYAILDTTQNTWEFRRVAYDIASVQKRMLEIGLPERHIQRLAAGW